MNLRAFLTLIITLAVLALCLDLSRQAHRIADDWHQAAASVTSVAAKADASATRIETSVSGVAAKLEDAAGRADRFVEGADAKLEKAVGNALSPLPATPSAPAAFSSLFHPAASPTSKPPKKP